MSSSFKQLALTLLLSGVTLISEILNAGLAMNHPLGQAILMATGLIFSVSPAFSQVKVVSNNEPAKTSLNWRFGNLYLSGAPSTPRLLFDVDFQVLSNTFTAGRKKKEHQFPFGNSHALGIRQRGVGEDKLFTLVFSLGSVSRELGYNDLRGLGYHWSTGLGASFRDSKQTIRPDAYLEGMIGLDWLVRRHKTRKRERRAIALSLDLKLEAVKNFRQLLVVPMLGLRYMYIDLPVVKNRKWLDCPGGQNCL